MSSFKQRVGHGLWLVLWLITLLLRPPYYTEILLLITFMYSFIFGDLTVLSYVLRIVAVTFSFLCLCAFVVGYDMPAGFMERHIKKEVKKFISKKRRQISWPIYWTKNKIYLYRYQHYRR